MMLHSCPDDPPDDDENPRPVALVVVTAALTAVATALAEWAVDELRARYGSAPPRDDRRDSTAPPGV